MPIIERVSEAERDALLRQLIERDPWQSWLLDAKPGDIFRVTFTAEDPVRGREARIRTLADKAGLGVTFIEMEGPVEENVRYFQVRVKQRRTRRAKAEPTVTTAPSANGKKDNRGPGVRW